MSLNVIKGGSAKEWIPYMDKTDGCPDHTFGNDALAIAGGEADEYQIYIYESDALGVDYFTLHDATNPREIRRWGAGGDGEGWCLSSNSMDDCWAQVSGANFPNIGVKLYIDGSSERIRFGSRARCKKDGACSSLDCATGNGCGFKKCCA